MSAAKPPNPRRVAVRALRDIEQRRGFSNRILSDQLERHVELARRDRGLITTLVYGVLRHQARLDALIDAAADKPGKLKGELRTILRVAAYELVELDRPPAIAGAEAVKVAKRIDPRGRLRGLITAIVAGVARDAPARAAAWEAGDPLTALRERWSLPAWLAARWLAALGPERALARARVLAEAPTLDLRIDLGRTTRDEVRARLEAEHPGLRFVELPAAAGDQPQAVRVQGAGDLFYGPLFESGLISIQSLGSQQAVRALDPRPGERIIDACAGMGTKTAQIAELMQRQGRLVAMDASAERLAELEAARERVDLDAEGLALEIVHADLAEDPLELDIELEPGSVDGLLLDAPCTGLGNLARHPELRWTAEPGDVPACAALQATLLRRCADWVRPGGRLVYAVCSLEPEEGPQVVADFVAERGEFRVVKEEAWTPEGARSDGFWLARLERG